MTLVTGGAAQERAKALARHGGRARVLSPRRLREGAGALGEARGAFAAAWLGALPGDPSLPLAAVHGLLRPDAPVELDAPLEDAREWLAGAGFEAIARGSPLRARRALTLPDYVRPRLCLLVVGLNPSLHAARSGVPFGRPGNRFWDAARRAGLVRRDRDPFDAVRLGLGFTDLAKRATRSAEELSADEYRQGLARVERLVARLRPRAVCFVGLEGWRRARDPRARPGWNAEALAGRPVYLMPSTSGRNAHATPDSLAANLAAAAEGASG